MPTRTPQVSRGGVGVGGGGESDVPLEQHHVSMGKKKNPTTTSQYYGCGKFGCKSPVSGSKDNLSSEVIPNTPPDGLADIMIRRYPRTPPSRPSDPAPPPPFQFRYDSTSG